jgi:hypothetical protein
MALIINGTMKGYGGDEDAYLVVDYEQGELTLTIVRPAEGEVGREDRLTRWAGDELGHIKIKGTDLDQFRMMVGS